MKQETGRIVWQEMLMHKTLTCLFRPQLRFRDLISSRRGSKIISSKLTLESQIWSVGNNDRLHNFAVLLGQPGRLPTSRASLTKILGTRNYKKEQSEFQEFSHFQEQL